MDKVGLRQEIREATKPVRFFLPIDLDNEDRQLRHFPSKISRKCIMHKPLSLSRCQWYILR